MQFLAPLFFVALAGLARSTSHHPLFQTMLVLDEEAGSSPAGGPQDEPGGEQDLTRVHTGPSA